MSIDILTEDQLAQLSQLISVSQNIIITCHQSPDGDAIGSSLAWASYLGSLGKEVTIIVPDQYPDFLLWLPNTEKIVRYNKHREKCDMLLKIADLVFCLDYNTPSRVDEMQQTLLNTQAKRVLIDHHLNPDVPTTLTISHPEACSTCEIVFRIVWQMGAFDSMDKHFAIPVYCGMMTDTGGFTFASSRPEIFYIISLLLTKHINKDKIYRNVYHNFSEWRLRLTGYVLYEKMHVFAQKRAAYFTLTRQDLRRFHYVKGDAEGLVNMPLQMKGIKLSISLREDTEHDNLIWVSLRSVDDLSCTKIAEKYFNGGGHLNASGGRLNCSMAEAEQIVRRAIEEL
jgi:phosphoesterase RecJ-like protein